MTDFKFENTKRMYDNHLKRSLEEYGFLPDDFEEALKNFYLAFEDINGEIYYE